MPHLLFTNLSRYENLIQHAIFNRHGGHSQKPFDTLNVRHGIGDNEQIVDQNRSTICQTLKILPNQLISANQTHSTNICVIKNNKISHPRDKFQEVDDIDAFITNQPGIYPMIQVADCQPILVFDPVQQVIANIHSGWRGSLDNIAGITIERLAKEFSTNPADCLVGVGPSLGPCCAAYPNEEEIFPNQYRQFYLPNKHVDFWALTTHQLNQAGVPTSNIEITKICTVCHQEDFFSYRATNGITGRFGAVIGLRAS